MGRKYDFKNLLAAAVERLTYENPTTLEEYDRLLLKDGDIRYLSTQITMCHGIVFDTITLAQENQLFAVLPCAYCRAILFYGEDQILDGISSPNSSHVNLCPLDQRACILGSKKMVQAQWEQAHPWDWISSDKCAEGCSDALGCATIKKEFLRAWLVHGLPILMQRTVDLGFCSACEPDCREAMAKGRKELWEKLPSFFDLPPWGELKNDL
ncbi:hypothetical protein DFH09DRAFT_1187495 [Mycena vulgaris]|nr:hypothetical protein DFH09DRAFT_1187495 [Mycena vulgaris]